MDSMVKTTMDIERDVDDGRSIRDVGALKISERFGLRG